MGEIVFLRALTAYAIANGQFWKHMDKLYNLTAIHFLNPVWPWCFHQQTKKNNIWLRLIKIWWKCIHLSIRLICWVYYSPMGLIWKNCFILIESPYNICLSVLFYRKLSYIVCYSTNLLISIGCINASNRNLQILMHTSIYRDWMGDKEETKDACFLS